MTETANTLTRPEFRDDPIRRTTTPPVRLQQVIDELGSGRTGTLISGPTDSLPEGQAVAFRSSRWSADAELPAGEELQFRELKACMLEGGRPFGAVIFHETRFSPLLDSSDLLMSFDDHSAEWQEASEVLYRHWSMGDLEDVSDDWFHLVEFSALWVHPEARPHAWQLPALHLIKQRYRNRAHLMLLKPFPLEYEGAGEARGAAKRAQKRRTEAMVRLYSRCLGAQVLDDPDRDQRWMYVRLNPGLPSPSLYDL